MNWMHRQRLRVLAFVLALALAALGTISLTALPLWPVVGVAIAAVAVMVNGLTSRLGSHVCLECGTDLAGRPEGAHGVACPSCGGVNPLHGGRASLALDDRADDAPNA